MIYPDLEGKVVLVTGASRGIGKSVVDAFVKNGCKVLAMYVDGKPELESGVTLLQQDVRDLEGFKRWLAEYEADGGRIDVFVNNAGVIMDGMLLDVQESQWDALMEVNLKGAFFLAQAVAEHMRVRGGGVIANAASFAAQMPSVSYGVYAASKAAIESLTKTMAAEWAPHNIRVNAYSPGVINTKMTEKAIAQNGEKMLEALSLRRFGEAEEVAAAVLFLCSNASAYITGTNLDISGGKFIVQNPGDAWKL